MDEYELELADYLEAHREPQTDLADIELAELAWGTEDESKITYSAEVARAGITANADNAAQIPPVA